MRDLNARHWVTDILHFQCSNGFTNHMISPPNCGTTNHSNSRPFNNPELVDHFNPGIVCYSNCNCTIKSQNY